MARLIASCDYHSSPTPWCKECWKAHRAFKLEGEEMIKKLGKMVEDMEKSHWCGMQGYGMPGDTCPACERERKNRE